MTLKKKTLFYFSVLALFTLNTEAKVDESYCYKDKYVLDCFDSLKHYLKDPHNNQLNRIVADIESADKKVKSITLIGHGVQYKASDPVTTNANNRARTVKNALINKLKSQGINTNVIDFNDYGTADAVPINDNSNQTQRALSRRVEVVVDYKKKKNKQDNNDDQQCKKRPALVKALNTMPKHTRTSVNCIAKKYQLHFSCQSELSGGYKWGPGRSSAIETVPRFLKGKPPFGEFSCKNLKGKKLKNCLAHIDKEIMTKPTTFKRDLVYLSTGLGSVPKAIRQSPECKFIRGLHKVSKDKHEIYSCYKKEFKEKFEICF